MYPPFAEAYGSLLIIMAIGMAIRTPPLSFESQGLVLDYQANIRNQLVYNRAHAHSCPAAHH